MAAAAVSHAVFAAPSSQLHPGPWTSHDKSGFLTRTITIWSLLCVYVCAYVYVCVRVCVCLLAADCQEVCDLESLLVHTIPAIIIVIIIHQLLVTCRFSRRTVQLSVMTVLCVHAQLEHFTSDAFTVRTPAEG